MAMDNLLPSQPALWDHPSVEIIRAFVSNSNNLQLVDLINERRRLHWTFTSSGLSATIEVFVGEEEDLFLEMNSVIKPSAAGLKEEGLRYLLQRSGEFRCPFRLGTLDGKVVLQNTGLLEGFSDWHLRILLPNFLKFAESIKIELSSYS